MHTQQQHWQVDGPGRQPQSRQEASPGGRSGAPGRPPARRGQAGGGSCRGDLWRYLNRQPGGAAQTGSPGGPSTSVSYAQPKAAPWRARPGCSTCSLISVLCTPGRGGWGGSAMHSEQASKLWVQAQEDACLAAPGEAWALQIVPWSKAWCREALHSPHQGCRLSAHTRSRAR